MANRYVSILKHTNKEHHWDLTRALLPDFYKIVDALREALEQVMKSLEPLAEAVIETFTTLRDAIVETNL